MLTAADSPLCDEARIYPKPGRHLSPRKEPVDEGSKSKRGTIRKAVLGRAINPDVYADATIRIVKGWF